MVAAPFLFLPPRTHTDTHGHMDFVGSSIFVNDFWLYFLRQPINRQPIKSLQEY